ncbi:hypothetical protein [Catenibacterium sp.]|uniref:hypothetical protein n=1 Tax=Catenibacterium sp. TaxID=2049022 RepID=UPI003992BA74
MNKSKSIVKQASISHLAGIPVHYRIIGVLYKSINRFRLGDEGNGVLLYKHNNYAMALHLFLHYGIPTAISKLISEKLALRQYNNARKIF